MQRGEPLTECHLERSNSAREADGIAKSKDPYPENGLRVAARSFHQDAGTCNAITSECLGHARKATRGGKNVLSCV